jgi:DNA (cytosine-5)-methyltransferase 1
MVVSVEMDTEYSDFLGTTLMPKQAGAPLVLDLFAGCGGLALGFEAQGFDTCGYEMDGACCATYRRNLKGECHTVTLTPATPLPPARVLIGGPPCQPFSVIGNQNGLNDSRNGFPVFVEAVRRLDPDIFLFENVRGLLYRSKPYFDSVLQKLKELGYVIEYQLVNAADYGVPQRRERLLVVGHRGTFAFPRPSARRVTAGDALGAMATCAPPESRFLTKSMDDYIARYEAASSCITPRDLHLDDTARTLTCRNLAGATSDMHRIRLPDGRRRRILPREAARLQSFPDWFQFEGTETEVFNQIGNAVPPLLAYHLAGAVRDYLNTEERLSPSEILYRNLPAQLELSLVHEPKEEPVTQFVRIAGKKRQTQTVVNEALHILSALGIPLQGLSPRRLEKMSMAFLAVCDVHRVGTWATAQDSTSGRALTSRQIVQYVNLHFEEKISSGSYDDIRRKDLKLPAVAGIILRSANDPDAATNNPTRAYALAPAYAPLVRAYGTEGWESDVEDFLSGRETLGERLNDSRPMNQLPVALPSGIVLQLSRGKHNQLQKAVIEDFLPRYGEGASVLYVGDAANKLLHVDKAELTRLRFFELAHDELPDVIAYSAERNWMYLIEAVHSSGPISKLRHEQLRALTKECSAEIVYVTAFLDRETFRKHAPDIAWETEVWIAEAPDHIVHFDGKRFLGPYTSE